MHRPTCRSGVPCPVSMPMCALQLCLSTCVGSESRIDVLPSATMVVLAVFLVFSMTLGCNTTRRCTGARKYVIPFPSKQQGRHILIPSLVASSPCSRSPPPPPPSPLPRSPSSQYWSPNMYMSTILQALVWPRCGQGWEFSHGAALVSPTSTTVRSRVLRLRSCRPCRRT